MRSCAVSSGMNNGIAAIAVLTFRGAWRSRLTHCVAALACSSILALVLTARGDGTLSGLLKLVIEYSLKAAFWILAVSGLWAGCGAVSEDIRRRHIQLLAVKPLRPSELWLGRWIGISAVMALTLAVCGVLVGAIASAAMNSSAAPAERKHLGEHVLNARWRLLPSERVTRQDVEKRLADLKADGTISERASAEDAWRYALQRVKWERSTVQRGESTEWTFRVPQSVRVPQSGNAKAWARIRLYSPLRDRRETAMEWTFAAPSGNAGYSLSIPPDGVHYLDIPPSLVKPGATLLVRFRHAGEAEDAPVMFDPDAPIEILVTRSGFAGNLARAVLIIFCWLSIVAAVGLTAGTAFSMPVALFVTVCVFIIASGSAFFTEASVVNYAKVHDPEKISAYARAASWLLGKISLLLEPLARLDPAQCLIDGVYIPWSATFTTCALILGTYAALLFAAGVFLLKRKELALPE